MSGNQSNDTKAKLKKLKEEEKILVKLLHRVNEQLNSLRVEEIILRRHLRLNDSSDAIYIPAKALTDGTEQMSSTNEAEMGTETTLRLDVDVLRSLVENGQGTNRSNQQEVEEEEEEDEDFNLV